MLEKPCEVVLLVLPLLTLVFELPPELTLE
jgi:hypothetical protein